MPGDRDGLVFRYVDPASGEVATASALADIPAAARREVVVFDTLAPPPPGWDLVADLTAAPPVRAVPRQGFAFAVAARPSASASAAAPDHREVVLFSTAGCGYCQKARAFLKSHRVPYTELDLEEDPAAPARLAALGRRAGVSERQLQGVPIVFVDRDVILGWDEARLKRLLHL